MLQLLLAVIVNQRKFDCFWILKTNPCDGCEYKETNHSVSFWDDDAKANMMHRSHGALLKQFGGQVEKEKNEINWNRMSY